MKEPVIIAYSFSNCSNRKYQEIFNGHQQFVLMTDQKYHGLLHQGFVANGAKVRAYSGLPINRSVTKKLLIREQDEEQNGISYHYYTTINFPILRQIMIMIAGFTSVLRDRKQISCIICDFLSSSNSLGMALAGKLLGIPVVTSVLDLPGLMSTAAEPLKGIHKQIARCSAGFIFLTAEMDNIVNEWNKPFIVMEGHCDSKLKSIPKVERWERSCGKRVVIYAGGIHRIFGLPMLVEGFVKANIAGAELRIFGDGDYRESLEQICHEHTNVKYMGVCGNKEVVQQEQRAALLINPRPSDPVYTRYSFPSKNMEYMAAGTPVMTTRLPGMPDEYLPYVYTIDDESVEGVAKALTDFFNVDLDKREEKATKAQCFVQKQKNNQVQAGRVLGFIREMF